MIVDLVERIYEAAAIPEQWPDVLSLIGRYSGGAGGLFFLNSPFHFAWVAAPEVRWIIERYIAEGWINENERGAPMIAELFPGFRTDSDFRSATERAALPVYRDFLIPHGIDAAAGSVFQGANDDAIVLTVENFPSHAAATAAVPLLDTLRPHLGRALSLTSRLGAKTASDAVDTLGLVGMSAAVVSPDGMVRAANDHFVARLGDRASTRRGKLQFSDAFVQAQLTDALAAVNVTTGVRSLAIPATDDETILALHLLPLRRRARDALGWDGVLLLLAEPGNASIPSADLLRLLFDLTPGEARVARLVAGGKTVAETALALRVGENAVRGHLKGVFAKIGGSRQGDLIRLLGGLGAPV